MKTEIHIPQIDLSDDATRRILIERRPGQYFGHPSSVKLEDDRTVFIAYPMGHGKGPLVLKRSDDAGKTWSERLRVPDTWRTSLEVPTLFRTAGPDGQKHLLLFTSLYPIRMAHSEDDGATWSDLAPIGDYGGIVAMGDMVCRGNGEYIAYFHDHGQNLKASEEGRIAVYLASHGGEEFSRVVYSKADGHGGWIPEEVWNSNDSVRRLSGREWSLAYATYGEREISGIGLTGDWHIYAVRSFDGGLTWSKPESVLCLPDVHLCEPGIVRAPGGKRLAMLLRENSRRYNSFVSFSDDMGLTWTEPRQLPPALTGDRHQALTLPDGRILVSFRDTLDESPTRGSWAGWVGTFDDIETGREGQYRILFQKNLQHGGMDCAYPTLEQFRDGTVFVSTYGHWTEGEPAWILGLRFTMSELDALAERTV